jgi:lipopolysaccharide biosynthesis regulator YciM
MTLGNLEEKLGNEEAAVDNWRRAAMVSHELSADALINLQRVMFQRGTFGDIEKIYRDVLAARPWDEHATLALASFYKKQGRGGEAIEFLEEYKSMHPESVATTVLLVSLYAMLKDRDELERFLEKSEANASALKPEYHCKICDFRSNTMRWHCPRCNAFDSFEKIDEK